MRLLGAGPFAASPHFAALRCGLSASVPGAAVAYATGLEWATLKATQNGNN